MYTGIEAGGAMGFLEHLHSLCMGSMGVLYDRLYNNQTTILLL